MISSAKPMQENSEFQRLASAHRAEIQLHCYRMMGSVHEAEDLTQETLVRAWRSFDRFENRTTPRRWLYRIATNACLNALEKRAVKNRYLPSQLGDANRGMPSGEPFAEMSWIEPFPDSTWEGVVDTAAGPDVRYATRDSVRLAFVVAVQRLPPLQRAVLLLRDVLGFSAKETAGQLELTVAAVNSALQRARSGLEPRTNPEQKNAAPAAAENELIERYVAAWEHGDFATLIHLLREDVTLVMPPWPHWYRGREAVREFLEWAFDWAWTSHSRNAFRLLPIRANGQTALALYVRTRSETRYHAHALQLLRTAPGGFQELHFFLERKVFHAFNLPDAIDGDLTQATRTGAPSQ